MAIITNTFSAGGTIVASEVNQNFSDLSSYVTALDDGDISADAGITSRKLLDRYALSHSHIHLLPVTSETGVTAFTNPLLFNLPTATTGGAATVAARVYPEFKAGRRIYLVAVSLYALAGTFTENPAIWVYHNTTLLSGTSGIVMTNVGPWYLKNSDPFGSPLAILDGAATPGDFIEFRLGRASGSTAANSQLRGLIATLTWKEEIAS